MARLYFYFAFTLSLSGCISHYVRLPNSASQVYSNSDIQNALLLLAQNNVMVHIPDATTRDFAKTEVDQKCLKTQDPFWSEKISDYLTEFRRKPELLGKFHVLELKRGDSNEVKIQRDLDGAVTVSIQYVKTESYGKVSYQSELPCKGSLAEYLGRDLVSTGFEFPTAHQLVAGVQSLPEKNDLPRFKFSNGFLTYLAERGTVFKFNHSMSFEKTSKGQYVMVELLNRLSDEVKQPFHQHINFWFAQINQQSLQARLIQLFAAVQDKDLKAGVRVETALDGLPRSNGEVDLTYLYITYHVENDRVHLVPLSQLESCLKSFTDDMTGLRLRKPAGSEKTSYLRPGYTCHLNQQTGSDGRTSRSAKIYGVYR